MNVFNTFIDYLNDCLLWGGWAGLVAILTVITLITGVSIAKFFQKKITISVLSIICFGVLATALLLLLNYIPSRTNHDHVTKKQVIDKVDLLISDKVIPVDSKLEKQIKEKIALDLSGGELIDTIALASMRAEIKHLKHRLILHKAQATEVSDEAQTQLKSILNEVNQVENFLNTTQ